MKTISDYDFARLSSFLDGELSRTEVNALIAEMESKPELKNLYFQMVELSHTSSNLKSLSIKRNLSNLTLQNLFSIFTQRLVLPATIFAVGAVMSYSILTNALNENEDRSPGNILIEQSIASVEAKQTLDNIENAEILQFASRHYGAQDNSALMPVAYTPKWVPAGFNTDPNTRNRFINRLNKKQFSVFISENNPNTLPDGTYARENFVLIKKTHYHGDKPHTIAVFGDIDIESGKKILNSIEVKH